MNDPIIEVLKRQLASLESVQTPAEMLDDDAEILADLGIDSLDYATVLVGCESELDVSVMEDDIDWREVRTIRQLAAVLRAASPAQ